jgi:hypothetical protein
MWSPFPPVLFVSLFIVLSAPTQQTKKRLILSVDVFLCFSFRKKAKKKKKKKKKKKRRRKKEEESVASTISQLTTLALLTFLQPTNFT